MNPFLWVLNVMRSSKYFTLGLILAIGLQASALEITEIKVLEEHNTCRVENTENGPKILGHYSSKRRTYYKDNCGNRFVIPTEVWWYCETREVSGTSIDLPKTFKRLSRCESESFERREDFLYSDSDKYFRDLLIQKVEVEGPPLASPYKEPETQTPQNESQTSGDTIVQQAPVSSSDTPIVKSKSQLVYRTDQNSDFSIFYYMAKGPVKNGVSDSFELSFQITIKNSGVERAKKEEVKFKTYLGDEHPLTLESHFKQMTLAGISLVRTVANSGSSPSKISLSKQESLAIESLINQQSRLGQITLQQVQEDNTSYSKLLNSEGEEVVLNVSYWQENKGQFTRIMHALRPIAIVTEIKDEQRVLVDFEDLGPYPK